jgi:hypothetical protein
VARRRCPSFAALLAALCLLLLPAAPAAAAGTVSIERDRSVDEIDAGATAVVFDIILTGADSQTQVGVSFSTFELGLDVAFEAQSGSGCGPGVDYVTTSGSVVLSAQAPRRQIPVPVCGDTLDEEPTEVFRFVITGVSGAQVGDGSAFGEIRDNDPLPTITVSATEFKSEGALDNAVFFALLR